MEYDRYVRTRSYLNFAEENAAAERRCDIAVLPSLNSWPFLVAPLRQPILLHFPFGMGPNVNHKKYHGWFSVAFLPRVTPFEF